MKDYISQPFFQLGVASEITSGIYQVELQGKLLKRATGSWYMPFSPFFPSPFFLLSVQNLKVMTGALAAILDIKVTPRREGKC